jgi:U3 small nucleolar RNA-associated protein 14
MQGWGTWTGESKAVQAKEYLVKKRLKDIQQKKTNQQFANIKNKFLKISNQIDKKFSNNYMVKELPHPYTSIHQYEKLNNTPLGPEWNTLSTYKEIVQPKVVKFIGKVIGNVGSISKNSIQGKKLTEIIDKATKKKIRTKKKI